MNTDTTDHIILGIDPGTNIMGYSLLKTHARNSEIITLDVINLKKQPDQSAKLKMIYESTQNLIKTYHPDILAIEEPFYGKNPQSMLKLGRAQGVVIGACLHAGLEVFEYTPRRIKQSITGKGAASKEQVAAMLHTMYTFSTETKYLDATDALAAAVTHHLQNRVVLNTGKASGWEAFLSQHKDRIIG
ncbi:MAG: crossover junction endodeoxyribonuclease RuvC [Bacteroidales bacterium]|nr:crossover junction endodeoxyribonuclease RuvC [Bacteroidales bacterium]